ncbi:acyltransferase [Mesorhizobium sp. CU2]|uniref:acyltransferase family protein n=1 Tax=unclassified Mesorhizobium TaxID=325217 RepID=UPI00112D8AE5|nr:MULTISPECIES: acyltransferase [unclassified Mesorhizobium]TPN88290.1 acyltransferase [Mesorhizobium sp. CU3]TPO05947.1 acyltransferase [Mesorhizobium sp. CU2]
MNLAAPLIKGCDVQKDDSLEFVRGAAAIVVLFWHSLLGFAPAASGTFAEGPANSLQTSIAFILFNGQSAVYLFFVLSSFVITRRYYRSRDPRDLLLGALKRLPRLAGPVVVTVVGSCLIYKLDLYFFKEAGALTGSPWLANFAHSPKVLSPESASLLDAVQQGSWRAFVLGDNYYDTSLWTMWYEFWGSLGIFALAPIIFSARDRTPILSWCIIALAICLAARTNYTFIAFLAGISIYLLLEQSWRPSGWVRFALIATSLFLLGYAGNAVGIYRPLDVVEFVTASPLMRQTLVATFASVMLVYTLLTIDSPPSWMTGKLARFLGDLSFPLYLVHVPIICSLGSGIFLASGSAMLGAIVAMLASIATALPLVAFNKRWVELLDMVVAKLRSGGRLVAVEQADTGR